MKIKSINIEGFRSLKNVDWNPGRLNVIIGPNGTGKSNLLRFLEMLSAAARGRLARHIQTAGGIKPLLWDGQTDFIGCRLETVFSEAAAEEAGICGDSMIYETLLRQIGYGSDYRIENELLRSASCDNNGEMEELHSYLQRKKQEGFIYNSNEKELIMPADAILDDELLLAVAASPFAGSKQISCFQKQLASWMVYHDMSVHQDAKIRQPVISRYETRVAPDGQNLISVLHTLYSGSRDFKQSIDSAIRAAFGNDFEELIFPPAADQRVQLRIRWSSLKHEQTAADLSDGTLYFLLLMAILNNPNQPALIAIDEPETGLHPSMLPIVAEHAVEASQRTQVVFTTHSSQFLDAFNDTKPVTTVASWSNGQTHFKVLDGEELDYWLQSYTLGTLFTSGELEGM